MAMILEIRDARGGVTWHRLDALPLAIGRAVSNDIILDDPYLDARHATITRDETGAISIADLGSVNGTHLNGASSNGGAVVEPGAEVRIGRTTLRFRDLDEAVAPALVDDHPLALATQPVVVAATPVVLAPTPRTTPIERTFAWLLGTTRGRMLSVVAMIAVFAWFDWLGETERSSGSDVLAAALAATAMAVVWAALWSIAGRGSDKRPHFMGHMAVVALAFIAMLAWTTVNDWLGFLFPSVGAVAMLFMVVTLVLIAAVIAGHLAVTSSLTSKQRWRAGFIAAGTVAVLFAFAALLSDDEKFTDVPKFAAELKPLPASFIPTRTIDDFGADMKELKDEVDKKLSGER